MTDKYCGCVAAQPMSPISLPAVAAYRFFEENVSSQKILGLTGTVEPGPGACICDSRYNVDYTDHPSTPISTKFKKQGLVKHTT